MLLIAISTNSGYYGSVTTAPVSFKLSDVGAHSVSLLRGSYEALYKCSVTVTS